MAPHMAARIIITADEDKRLLSPALTSRFQQQRNDAATLLHKNP